MLQNAKDQKFLFQTPDTYSCRHHFSYPRSHAVFVVDHARKERHETRDSSRTFLRTNSPNLVECSVFFFVICFFFSLQYRDDIHLWYSIEHSSWETMRLWSRKESKHYVFYDCKIKYDCKRQWNFLEYHKFRKCSLDFTATSFLLIFQLFFQLIIVLPMSQ